MNSREKSVYFLSQQLLTKKLTKIQAKLQRLNHIMILIFVVWYSSILNIKRMTAKTYFTLENSEEDGTTRLPSL